ncbi:MAG: hypothetical protein ABI723_21655 [Bacteroidia bacterium]
MADGIRVSVIHGDAYQIKADALVLKYAQSNYGLSRDIVRDFKTFDLYISEKLPRIGDYFFTESKGITCTKGIIFLGVNRLMQFGYKEIREFGRRALASLAVEDPSIRKIVMTIHGPGYGLDEIEAFESQLAGISDSISADDYPHNLSEIIFVEISRGRANRLRSVLDGLFPDSEIHSQKSDEFKSQKNNSTETLRSVGYDSNSKKSIFVAMPFAQEFDDCFHYGIQGAVNSCGYLCERADLQSFTGDVMQFVKERIAKSDFLIADLSTSNPNVYLEIGYAWGLNKQTILLVKDTKELKFDTQGQRCIRYTTIKELEIKLKEELSKLNL